MKNFISSFSKYLYISTTIIFLVMAGIALSILLIGVVTKSSPYDLDSIARNSLNLPASKKMGKAHTFNADGSDTTQEIRGEYHHIKKWVEKDKWSFCVDCHGSVDHSKTKEVRSFLNMHSQFISCEVCHVSMQEPSDPSLKMHFGWVDLKEGKLVSNPNLEEGRWGDYGAKVVQVTGAKASPTPLTLTEERDFYLTLKAKTNKPDSMQEIKNNEVLHQNLLEKPLDCVKCHTSKENFFPFLQLGYTQARKDFLMDSEVVDLIENLQTFFIPSLIKSEQGAKANSMKGNP